jgi:uncharacterized membrane protein (DUF4010 family)
LISLLGAVFTVLDRDVLLLLGGLLVIVQGVMLAVEGLADDDEGLSLTTSVSMLVAYGVGSLAAGGYVLVAVAVTMLSTLVLVLKRELHNFAWGITHEELRSTTEFAILAFVIYPLLPAEGYELEVQGEMLTIEPRIIWLMVVTVAGIGIVNYAIVETYGGRGIAVTGFFGGLASSTAVVGTMLDHVRQEPAASSFAVAAILLANAAMAARNLVITIGFTITNGLLVGAIVPLGTVVLGCIVVAAATADWSQSVEMDLETPFSLRNALLFGGLFLLVVVAGGAAQIVFGTAGLYVTMALSGLVSSAGATTSAVLLYRGGGIEQPEAVIAVLIATGASIVVKIALTASSPERTFALKVAVYSVVVLLVANRVLGVDA